ncbi:DUF1048 domain-containing protein [Acaricomes phytoseiuli]|uniref:DUF1048 domain-containing protein n=1 Tax=Acaricomes phytoseiuli TaxID=291968 RepID=UPI00037FBAD7|nr:DUF1048 domain-containing protein [Acaricomes phytoseiuli]MCW1250300.1 DUF1048 domain-containing protein [Acaricomes phytoseiuli]
MLIEKITGDLADKRRWRENKARIAALPENYRTAAEALGRYFMYFGAISQGDVLVTMLGDLADLFEEAAAEQTPIRSLIGEDPVDFAETFIKNYTDGQWISKERRRLITAIDRAAGDGAESAE